MTWRHSDSFENSDLKKEGEKAMSDKEKEDNGEKSMKSDCGSSCGHDHSDESAEYSERIKAQTTLKKDVLSTGGGHKADVVEKEDTAKK